MHALAVKLCLVGLLASPLLCQAEAAETLARSLAELVRPNVIEPAEQPDGEALCFAAPAMTSAGSVHLLAQPFAPAVLAHPFPPLPTLRALPSVCIGHPPEVISSLRRQAELQVFLF